MVGQTPVHTPLRRKKVHFLFKIILFITLTDLMMRYDDAEHAPETEYNFNFKESWNGPAIDDTKNWYTIYVPHPHTALQPVPLFIP